MHAELEQHGHGIGVLDALCNRFNLALARRGGKGADRLLQLSICQQRMHQLAVDLDVCRLENIENLEAVLVDAVVFECKADPGLTKCLGSRLGFLDEACCFLLGNLQDEVLRPDAEIVQLLDNPAGQ